MTGAQTRTPVAGGFVRLLMPQGPNGTGRLVGLSFSSTSGVPNKAVTHSDGSYTFTIDESALTPTREYPLFLAASDSAQTLTMIAELPKDIAIPQAQLTIDINPTSTLAGQLICPGGVSPPPANTWCYSDPNTPAASSAAMRNLIDTALAGNLSGLSTGTPPDWQTFAGGFLNDPSTYEEIKNVLTGQGITWGSATPTTIKSKIATLPLVTPPVPADANTPVSDNDDDSCRIVWNCNNVAGCITVYGSNTGSAAEPDLATCNAVCASQGACTCQGC
ncbi:MAG: hypothetical protein A2X94_07365 [Bdellovibrionales bacterium GWB1_55_8]|nr:MAG: hypothetical protein A2X94_07365 [Bdellovibrionales bacterium GWB1_55_8]